MTVSKPGVAPTIRDVARLAGVSVATASRSLNMSGGMKEVTRERVLNAARTLGYDLNNLRPRRPERPERVSFLYHRQHYTLSSNPFYSQVLHGVEEACRDEKIALSLSSIGAVDDIPELIGRQGAEGLVCVGYFDPAHFRGVLRLGLPTVIVDHWYPGLSCVNSDNFGGAYLATEHLIQLGRRRIAFVSGQPTHYSITQRAQGYRHALLSYGLPLRPELEVARDPVDAEEGAQAAVRHLLSLPEPPDAVFAFNDATALQVLRACHAEGLRVPEDLAVVGFDDLVGAAAAFPPLSTIRVDKEELGRRGLTTLLARPAEPTQVIVPVSLVVRESSVAR